jgi:hypothetical protein
MVFKETGVFPEKWSVYLVFGDAGHQRLQQKNTILEESLWDSGPASGNLDRKQPQNRTFCQHLSKKHSRPNLSRASGEKRLFALHPSGFLQTSIASGTGTPSNSRVLL